MEVPWMLIQIVCVCCFIRLDPDKSTVTWNRLALLKLSLSVCSKWYDKMLPDLSGTHGKSFILPLMDFLKKHFSPLYTNLREREENKYLYTVSTSVNPPDHTVSRCSSVGSGPLCVSLALLRGMRATWAWALLLTKTFSPNKSLKRWDD